MQKRKLIPSKHNVTILVMGDDGVGKTSLIGTLVSNHFCEDPIDIHSDISLPENEIFNSSVTVTITDSSQQTSPEELACKVSFSFFERMLATQ